jgi:nitroreductase
MKRFLFAALVVAIAAVSAAEPQLMPSVTPPKPELIPLLTPDKTGGLPLMDALAKRSTARAFASRELPPQELSNLLWAAFGVNRADGKRTAPSARDRREVAIYVLTARGAYLYEPAANSLSPVVTEDVRPLGGQQSFVATAPATLVFVADLARMGTGSVEEKKPVAYIDTGYVSQNVYLYCASAGLVTGARMMVDRPALAAKLHLRDDQMIVLAQSVGYPAGTPVVPVAVR